MKLFVVALLLFPLAANASDWSAAFSPGSDSQTAESLVIDTIAHARKTIRLAAYSFTSKPIAKALVDARKRGVEVTAVLDRSNLEAKYSGAHFLANMGIPVRIDARYAIMHNKFMVIDGNTVETGSFNYTKSAAQRNAENVLVIRNNEALASQYEMEWQRLWNESDSLAAH